jgi:hypothetical protein
VTTHTSTRRPLSKPGKAIAAMITIVVVASVVFFVITTIQAAHGIR